ncbi:hypothetical protein BV20DRAFT_962402 [Pilatotrama ljubarskyi]|nr:hypothetical protein BV20DRAFT_962402 [Pilatotrama ljubarskyi]
MSLLEPPTVTTRPPPPSTPDLPSSPPPSRHGASSPEESRTREASRDRGKEEAHDATRQPSCDAGDRGISEERDGEGRLKRKRGRHLMQPHWRKLLEDWKLWLTLENSGSVARDHLASERTFLAYARTSLTIAYQRVALVQLFTLSAATTNKDMERFARPLGAVMIILGLLTLGVGVFRYFLVQDALIRGVYPVARISPSLLSFAMLVLVIVVLVIILIAR